jgi:hypothetical protein
LWAEFPWELVKQGRKNISRSAERRRFVKMEKVGAASKDPILDLIREYAIDPSEQDPDRFVTNTTRYLN